jgi:MFS family permease
VADRRRRSTLILIFGLSQVPLYVAYGLANSYLPVILLGLLHGMIYAFIQPAVDSHVAAAAASTARARVMGLYSAFGLIGSFVGANFFSYLYSWNFRAPLFTIAFGYGSCVLLGGLLIRKAETKYRWLLAKKDLEGKADANAG